MQEGDLLFQPHPAVLGHRVQAGHHLGGGGGRAVTQEEVTEGQSMREIGWLKGSHRTKLSGKTKGKLFKKMGGWIGGWGGVA